MFIIKMLKIVKLFEMVSCVPKRFTYVCICFNTIQDLELVKSHLLPTMQEETYTQS